MIEKEPFKKGFFFICLTYSLGGKKVIIIHYNHINSKKEHVF